VLSATYAFSGGRRLPFFRDVNMPPAANVFIINLPSDLVVNGQTLFPAGVYGPLPFYCNSVVPVFSNSPAGSCPLTGMNAATGRPLATLPTSGRNVRRLLQAESIVNSSYHGLILRASRRMNRGLLFDTHFTWSHAIDNGQNSQTFFATSGSNFDPFNNNLDRARSDFDRRWRWISTFVWQPEGTFDMQGTKKKVLGGWSLSGVFTWGDGFPITPSLSGFLSGCSSAANVCSIDSGSSNGSGGTFRFPFLGRNTFESQNFSIFDMRISRSFRLGERYRIEAIAEAFNLFNHPGFVSYDTNAFSLGTSVDNVTTCGGTPITSGNRCLTVSPLSGFLTPRAASSTLNNPREFQFAVKFYW